MEGISKDLSKLEGREGSDAAAIESVDASIAALERWKAALLAGVEDGDGGLATRPDEGDDPMDAAVDGPPPDDAALGAEALRQVQACSTKLAENQKEWYSAMNKFAKSVEKRFNADLSPLLPLPPAGTTASPEDDSHMFFSSEDSKRTIDNILAMHFARSGRDDVVAQLRKESGVSIPAEKLQQFSILNRISDAIRDGDLKPAFQWVDENRDFLQRRESRLEYHLHRSQYVRLLLSDTYPLPSTLAGSPFASGSDDFSSSAINGYVGTSASSLKGPKRALAYSRAHFQPFYAAHVREISRLSAAALYLPVERLLVSPYRELFTAADAPPIPMAVDGEAGDSAAAKPSPFAVAPAVNPTDEIYHAPHLVELFASEYCTSLSMPRDLPLKVMTDIGGGGALAKIAKVRGVMKEKRTEWSTVTELPVEIAIPNEYRYHSVFACPVSKEQATETNPPMMMPCGHVVADQTLHRLSKGGQNVRCPYCPLSSAVSQALKVTF